MKNISLLFKWLPIIISIIALIISIFSYFLSKNIFEYEQEINMFKNTPAIKEEIVDPNTISFTLNSENAELQSVTIVFPSEISDNPISINTKPIQLSKTALETRAQTIINDLIIPKDSCVYFGHFSIPIMIDYSAIVYGFPISLRENRFLIFEIYYENSIQINYSNSYLINKCSYPLVKHNFYTGPFSNPLKEKIYKQDKEDVQILLKNQLDKVINEFLKSL